MIPPLTHLKTQPGYSLTESERTTMRAKLEQLTRETPVTLRQAVPSPWFIYLARPFPVAFVALLLMVSTGSVSFAAGGALPGDFLYPVKVKVNERVEVALAPSTEAKAQTHVRQAEERLRETEVLAARGDLTEEVTVAAAVAVADSVEEASVSASALADDGDTEAAAGIHLSIASALQVHAELLDAQAENFNDESGTALRTLSLAVASTAADVQVSPEEDGDLDETGLRLSAEAARARAEGRLDMLSERLEDTGIPQESKDELADELARLSEEFTAMDGALELRDYRDAALAYDAIDRRAYRTLTLLESAQDIGKETNQEVVITLGQEEEVTGASESAPVLMAARAKTGTPTTVMSMMLSLEAPTTTEVTLEDATATTMVMVEDTMNQKRAASPKLEFRLRSRTTD